MDRKPEFFILSGPNGAGKSVNGHVFVPASVPIFNGDLVYADLAKKYQQLRLDQLGGGVAKALEDARNKALVSKSDFAFESNYSSEMATHIVNTFKEAEYNTTLIYFGLDSIEESAQRVKERTGTGGHSVKPEVIEFNFGKGADRVKKDLQLFDKSIFVDTQNQRPQTVAIFKKDSKQFMGIEQQPAWYKKHFEKTILKLQKLNDLMKKKRIKSSDRKNGLSP